MGLKKYAVEQTGTLTLLDTSDQPMLGDDQKPMVVTLYGPGSKQYARAQAANANRITDRMRRKGKSEQSAEQRIAENAGFLADCTKEFSDNIGSDYPGLTGRDLFVAVYSDLEVGFVADQVAKHLGDWANFTKGSTKP